MHGSCSHLNKRSGRNVPQRTTHGSLGPCKKRSPVSIANRFGSVRAERFARVGIVRITCPFRRRSGRPDRSRALTTVHTVSSPPAGSVWHLRWRLSHGGVFFRLGRVWHHRPRSHMGKCMAPSPRALSPRPGGWPGASVSCDSGAGRELLGLRPPADVAPAGLGPSGGAVDAVLEVPRASTLVRERLGQDVVHVNLDGAGVCVVEDLEVPPLAV